MYAHTDTPIATPSGLLVHKPGWGRTLGIAGPNEHVSCRACDTTFPVIDRVARCNGHQIDRCPWCRADSAPWMNGRGI